jgi:hypothetical protein
VFLFLVTHPAFWRNLRNVFAAPKELQKQGKTAKVKYRGRCHLYFTFAVDEAKPLLGWHLLSENTLKTYYYVCSPGLVLFASSLIFVAVLIPSI